MSDVASTNISLNPGECLYVEGDSSEKIFHLSKGVLELTRETETVTYLDQRNDPVGLTESALKIPRLTTVRARDQSVLKAYDVKGDGVLDWVQEHPLTGYRVIRNNAKLLNHYNKINKALFKEFRDVRDSFEPLLEPVSNILSTLSQNHRSVEEKLRHTLEETLDESLPKVLVRHYRTIVNSTGRSVKQVASDLEVPEEIQETFESDDLICEEGGQEETFFILLQGTLSVLKEGQRVATIDEPGSIFGEMSALLSGERTATIQADSDCRVAVFPEEKLMSIFEENHQLALKILQGFLKRVQRAVTLNRSLEAFVKSIRQIEDSGQLPASEEKKLQKTIRSIAEHASDDSQLRKEAQKLKDCLEDGFELIKSGSV